MRILMLNHEYPPLGGGSGVAMKHLAESLVHLGHSVLVLTIANKEESYKESGVYVLRMPIRELSKNLAGFRIWISFLRKSKKYLRRAALNFKPDILNSHFIFPSGYVVAKTRLEIPHIASVVGADIHDPTRYISADRNLLTRRFTKVAISHSSIITTPSLDLTERTRSIFPKARVETIPWGVPKLICKPSIHINFHLPRNAFIITSVCRLVKRKRLDLLLTSIANTTDRRIFAIIIGKGPERRQLHKLSEKLNISEQIFFTDHISEDHKAYYFKISDVFCLPSEHEGFGLVFIEAMSMGLPVITTNIGGQNDIIRDGRDGFLVPVNDTQAITDRILLLSHNSALLKEMSSEAILRAQEFLPSISAQKFLKLFTEVSANSHV